MVTSLSPHVLPPFAKTPCPVLTADRGPPALPPTHRAPTVHGRRFGKGLPSADALPIQPLLSDSSCPGFPSTAQKAKSGFPLTRDPTFLDALTFPGCRCGGRRSRAPLKSSPQRCGCPRRAPSSPALCPEPGQQAPGDTARTQQGPWSQRHGRLCPHVLHRAHSLSPPPISLSTNHRLALLI